MKYEKDIIIYHYTLNKNNLSNIQSNQFEFFYYISYDWYIILKLEKEIIKI